METYTFPYVKWIGSGNLLCDAGSYNQGLCDNLGGGMGWEVARRFRREGTHVYLRLILVDVWQRPIQYCKAIILQLKINTSGEKKDTKTNTGL